MTEILYRLIDLASTIAELTGAQIAHLANPRKEADTNDLVVANSSILGLV